MVAPAAPRQAAPLVALIADRDAETRRMYAEFLALSDCRIEQAEDGRDALAKVFSRQPDVVITETHLPGINGFELCALLRQDTATRSIPIVLVAAEKIDIDADVERAENAGERMHGQIARSETLLDRSRVRRRMLNSTHTRHDTTTPPIPPPLLKCPECDQPLRYVRSHIGGVTAQNSEQWDYFECRGTCGSFQYRERTRKLRRV
jgi:CheY-like chemotaxis protein